MAAVERSDLGRFHRPLYRRGPRRAGRSLFFQARRGRGDLGRLVACADPAGRRGPYGKLGGLELGYGSDLDIVFLHGSRGARQQTDGEKCVDNAVFFARLGQRIIHYLTTATAEGTLYELDFRLRPAGAKGLLVNGVEALRDYLFDQAWTWEHQALVRARVVAGSPALEARFAEIRRQVLLMPRDPDMLKREVREMRQRMRAELGSESRGAWP